MVESNIARYFVLCQAWPRLAQFNLSSLNAIFNLKITTQCSNHNWSRSSVELGGNQILGLNQNNRKYSIIKDAIVPKIALILSTKTVFVYLKQKALVPLTIIAAIYAYIYYCSLPLPHKLPAGQQTCMVLIVSLDANCLRWWMHIHNQINNAQDIIFTVAHKEDKDNVKR